MKKLEFFKPTATYKEFIILDAVESKSKITQRELADLSGSSVSMINQYLENFEKEGFVNKKYLSIKNVEYLITSKGIERKRLLNIMYLIEIQKSYKEAKVETTSFLKSITKKGFRNIIFYGAGEVAEIFLQTLNDDHSIPINVVGVIDDNTNKQGNEIVNKLISSIDIINNVEHDAIMIASYNNYKIMYDKLIEIKYPKNKIVYFFQNEVV